MTTANQKNHARLIYNAIEKYIDLLAVGRYTTIIITNPDYIAKYPRKDSIEFVKEFKLGITVTEYVKECCIFCNITKKFIEELHQYR